MTAATDHGPFSNAPLELLFPDAGASELDRIRRAAADLDEARPAGNPDAPDDPPRWWWHLSHATYPVPGVAGIPVVISTSVLLDDSGGEYTEVELDVSWPRSGVREVTAQFGVACHCETDHAGHLIHQIGTPAADGSALASAFEDAVRTLIGWIADPIDPAPWRIAVGLATATR